MTLFNWFQVLFGCATIVSAFVAVANYLNQREQRVRGWPRVKATINKTYYRDGWRSLQLHVVPASDQTTFAYDQWCVMHAKLLSPRDAVLARAENDDYATGVFFSTTPVREIAGKATGRPQRFALEFFILFKGEERGRRAKLRVTYGAADGSWRARTTLAVAVPLDASEAPVSSDVSAA